MPVNRLRNIDEIVTQSGTVVDLENIQASGSGGTVSASGLAITRAEDSDSIDYSFNVGSTANPHAANGSSASASEMLQVGGAINDANHTSPSNGISVMSIASASDQIISATISFGRYGGTGTSDGAEAFLAGGASDANSGTFADNVDKYNFSSQSVTGTYTRLNTARRYASSSSDGTTAIFFGGMQSTWPAFDTFESLSFSGSSTATQWTGVRTSAGGASTSNGSESLLNAGNHADGLNSGVKRISKLTHAANASLESWGESTQSSDWNNSMVSNGVDAFQATGNPSTGDAYIEKLSFSDSTAHTVENSSATALDLLGNGSSGSDGSHGFFINKNSARSVSFDSGAAASNFCTMSVHRGESFGTQGN